MRGRASTAIVAVAVLLAIPVAVDPGSGASRVAYLAAFGLAVTAAWTGALGGGTGGRLPWVFIAAALSSWLAGDVLDAIIRHFGPDPTGLTPSDALWLLGYPLLGAGVLMMI